MKRAHQRFEHLTNVDEALKAFLDAAKPVRLKSELQPISACAGRVLAEDVLAPHDLPFSDQSVVDGFALRSSCVQNASVDNPIALPVIGESKLGLRCRVVVEDLQAATVATGSVLPRGADSVVPVEKVVQNLKSQITLMSSVGSGSNIIHKGEDFQKGGVVIEKGHRLRPQDLGALRVLGVTKVRVAKKPRVGVMATGSELVSKRGRRSEGKVVDINRLILSTTVTECGGQVMDLGIVDDDSKSIVRASRRALRSCDLILVTGGSSVGLKDLVPECINAIGKPGMIVHGVAMRPSKPTGLAVVNHVPIISLPGIPVSAMFAFHVFGKPILSMLLGARESLDGKLNVVLSETVRGVSGLRCFVRVKLKVTESGIVAEPLKVQKSSALSSMVQADAYIVIPENVEEFRANEKVEATLLV